MIRLLVPVFILFSFFVRDEKPTLYLIGDSTVKAGQGNGGNGMWGWGSVINQLFDTGKINVENHAIGGRSSRTFLTDGRWEPLLEKMNDGDYLIIQFGHNDDWALNDTIRARGTIDGIGEEFEEIDNLLTHKHEVVHSFGWYLRKYVNEAKAKGVEVFICSPIPFNRYDGEGLIPRKPDFYPVWASQVAEQTETHFINLHEMTAQVYDKLGYEIVKKAYFTDKDDVHTNRQGAHLNAGHVVKGVEETDSSLKNFLKP
ncbi:rhamnogalacturonan acetylesterase [Jiulongibacter sediminis]|jgi:lysophospholipase L1-like esterase|uniref:rhamnogalacturonan acetylesterase n=1 Tax=Jiulongibacter sediminis TaxID=1605367 RepID=UPI0026EC22F7|nr:rhamnogalacturonan acetylesterase [Jiulongibacter sediminis]